MSAFNPAVVLAQPPFFRLLGSHNDRGPLELAYIASYIEQMGIQSVILNLDYSGAEAHCSWRNLYERSHLLSQALQTDTSLLYESAEIIMGLDPECVVLSAGDSLTPWVDLGNAWFSAKLASLLRRNNIPVIGVGPRLRTVPPSVSCCFDAIIQDVPLSTAAGIVLSTLGDSTPPTVNRFALSSEANILPLISADASGSKYDVVMTSIGCVKSCTFCDAAAMRYKEVDSETVSRDIATRDRSHIDLGDAIFLPRPARLRTLRDSIRKLPSAPSSFSCELSLEMTSDAQLQRLVDFGIVEVKVGIESGDDESIKAMNKRHSAADVELACNRIADAGIDLTVYILLGGPIPHARRAAARTLNLCERIPAIDFVINVWAYNRPDPKPSDTHFSWDLVVEYGIEDLMPAFWQLQPQSKKSLGRIIDIHASRRPAVGASGSLSDESGQGSP